MPCETVTTYIILSLTSATCIAAGAYAGFLLMSLKELRQTEAAKRVFFADHTLNTLKAQSIKKEIPDDTQ